jgi:hypothetical protein
LTLKPGCGRTFESELVEEGTFYEMRVSGWSLEAFFAGVSDVDEP